MSNNVVLMGDEQSKAIQEAARFGSKALDIPIGLGKFIERLLGSVPEDLVGILGGDWLRAKRAENLFRTLERFERLVRKRGIKEPMQLSPNVATPMLEAASNESRSELQDIWSRLMAAAVDPSREKSVRASFIAIVKQMDRWTR